MSYTALVAVMIGLLLAIVPAQAQCGGRRGPNDTQKALAAALLFLAAIASNGNSGGYGYYHQPAPPPVWGYNLSYNPGYGNPAGYGERGSYSSDWNATGRWNEYEQVRTPDGGKYSRSTTCDPRWGCETTVSRTEVFRGPYLGHSGPPPP